MQRHNQQRQQQQQQQPAHHGPQAGPGPSTSPSTSPSPSLALGPDHTAHGPAGMILSVRIASMDHVLVPPGPLDRTVAPFLSSEAGAWTVLPRVPVLRVFGTYRDHLGASSHPLANAKAACVHVHGVYPYLFVQYMGDPRPDPLAAFIHRLGLAINAALSSGKHTTPNPNPNPNPNPPSQSSQPERNGPPPPPPAVPPFPAGNNQKIVPHVIAIHPIRALPFYGYHTSPYTYLKIHLVDPSLISRLAHLLASGAILRTPLQPLESHLPYHLQFLADHALDGMGWMHLSSVLVRPPLPPGHAPELPTWNTARFANVPGKATHCDLEVDVHASMIVNYHTRQRAWQRRHTDLADQHGPAASVLLQSLTQAPSSAAPASSRFLISSLDAIWGEEAKRRAALGLPAYVVPPIEPRAHVQSPCNAPRWAKELDTLFAQRQAGDEPSGDAVGHAHDQQQIPWIQESVCALWPTGFRSDLAALPAPLPPPVAAPVGGRDQREEEEEDWQAYPDLVAFSQRAHVALSQQHHLAADRDSDHQITPPASQHVADMADQVDLVLTQQVLEQMVAQEKDSDDQDSDIEDVSTDAPNGPAGADAIEDDHGLADDDDAMFVAAAARLDFAFHDADWMNVDSEGDPPLQVQHDDDGHDEDFQLDDHPSWIPSHRSTIPQFDGTGDSSDDNERAPEPYKPSHKRHRRNGPSPATTFAETPRPELPTFFAILDQSPGAPQDHPLQLDPAPCVSIPRGTWSPRDDAEVWSPMRPRARQTESQWRLLTRADEILQDDCVPPETGEDVDVVDVPSSSPSSSDLCASVHVSDHVEPEFSSVIVDIEAQILPTPRPGPERQRLLPMLPPSRMPSHRPAHSHGSSRSTHRAPPSPGLHVYVCHAPTVAECEQALLAANLPLEIHQKPFYGDPKDAHIAARARTFAGRTYRIPLQVKDDVSKLPTFYEVTGQPGPHAPPIQQRHTRPVGPYWTFACTPPSASEATRAHVRSSGAAGPPPSDRCAAAQHRSQLEKMPGGHSQAAAPDISQLPTPRPKHAGSRVALDELRSEPNALLCLGVEVHTNARGNLMPDPAVDPVLAVFYALYSDAGLNEVGGETYWWGVLTVDTQSHRHLAPSRTQVFASEADMVQGLIALTRKWDPDALLGYELHGGSWGYLIERCHRIYGFDLTLDLSRIITTRKDLDTRTLNAWGYRKGSSFTIAGRLVLNVWRLLRSEINLTDYSLESTVAHVLKRRFPRFSPRTLMRWWANPATRHRTVTWGIRRTLACMQLMVSGSYLDRTAEFARVYGIEFMGVLTRGSQYRVEAVMMRLARRLGYILVSPTRYQVAAQRAAECTPLVMEPESAFYPDPVVVLDFQSLYPSIMIAYNLCFSTCVGKLMRGRAEVSSKLGCDDGYKMPSGLTKDMVTVTPNGIMFVKSQERGGLLPKLLVELLETRVMIKQSMKLYKDNKAITRLLDVRQLSLKLLANVIYGYTAASFSGRMPMVELGDAVVQTGRETLERGIQLINAHPEWRARVVYGDTDSLFIELKGATKSRAFQIGASISQTISSLNPQPIHLKFEKVYLPCVLVTKKRYIGHKFEAPDHSSPDFDAKGIETVRRDGCPATGIIMKTALEVLFVHRDVSKVKAYVTRQFAKLMEGRLPIKDLIIAKEVKLGKYSDRVLPPPGAYLSMQKMRTDPRSEPQYGQRVPFVVAYGAPGDRLVDQVMCPRDVLQHAEYRIHAHYYITKQIIPALMRLFQLFGADINEWYAEMPKVASKVQPPQSAAAGARTGVGGGESSGVKRITLDQYYQTRHCAVCDVVVPAAHLRSMAASSNGHVLICDTCRGNETKLVRRVMGKVRATEMRYKSLARLCTDCIEMGPLGVADIECDSLVCSVFYDRVKAAMARRQAVQLAVAVGVVGQGEC